MDKRYEEALERAKAAIKDCGDNLGRKKMIYGIFPELQESEDEKNWKAVLGYVKDDALRVWLEKQKEQKPAEWSEEDKRAIDRACVALRAYSNGELPEFLPSELLGYADRLQSLRPQAKQEQTAEEEEYVRTIKSLVADAIRLAECNEVKDGVLGEIIAQSGPNIDFYQRLIDWVEGRHVYQSAEWSEEDEKMRESAISFVQAVNSCRYILGVDKHDVINWLKSRRPRWKPTEEQMLELKRAIEEMEKIDSNTASTLALLKFDLQNL